MFFQVSLQLYSAGLTTLQPGALGIMSNLQDLHLEYNNITVIHNDTFTNCFKLMNLFLENNNIKVCTTLQHVTELHQDATRLCSVMLSNGTVKGGQVMV